MTGASKTGRGGGGNGEVWGTNPTKLTVNEL